MFAEGTLLGAVVKTISDVNKATEMDEQALKKYGKAFERSKEAELLVQKKIEFAEKRVANVAKKKRAILKNTVPQFVDVYSRIQKVEISVGTSQTEIGFRDIEEKLNQIDYPAIIKKNEFTDKELLSSTLFKGIGNTIKADSERYLSAASSQSKASFVVYSQAESMAEVYDMIIGRADRISNILMRLNVLFVASIQQTDKTIQKNGLDISNYTEYEKGVLMTCVNIAVAMADMMNIPVLDESGQLSEKAVGMIASGEEYLDKMQSVMTHGI